MTLQERNRQYARDYARRQGAKKIARDNQGARLCQRKHGGQGKCLGQLQMVVTRDGSASIRCERCARFTAGQCASCPNPVDGPIRRARYCAWCRKLKQKASHQAYRERHRDEVRRREREANKRRRARCTESRRRWKAKNPGRDRLKQQERAYRRKLEVLRGLRAA